MNIQQHIHFLFLFSIIFGISHLDGIFGDDFQNGGIAVGHKIVKRKIDNKNPNKIAKEIPYCIFAFATYTDSEDINVGEKMIADKMLDKLAKNDENENAIKMIKEQKSTGELFTVDGYSMRLPGFSQNKLETISVGEDPQPSTSTFEIVEMGNVEMAHQLLEWANQGGAIRALIKGSPELFNETSGFVKSQVRFVRTMYCIQKIAYLLKKKADIGKIRKVKYAIGGIWIGGKSKEKGHGEKIVKAMQNVANLKNKIKAIVNGGVPFKFDVDEARKKRNELAKAIKIVANLEKGEGSSMDLVGLLWSNSFKYLVNIAANDTFISKLHKEFKEI